MLKERVWRRPIIIIIFLVLFLFGGRTRNPEKNSPRREDVREIRTNFGGFGRFWSGQILASSPRFADVLALYNRGSCANGDRSDSRL